MARRKRYPGNIARRGTSWRIRLCVGARYHHFTLGLGATRQEAENYAVEQHAKLVDAAKRAMRGRPGPTRFSEVCDAFIEHELPLRAPGTQESYQSAIDVFRRYFASDPFVRDIEDTDVTNFMEWRRTARGGKRRRKPGSVSAFTVAGDRRVLSVLFEYARRKKFVDVNPCAGVRPPTADDRSYVILNDDQLAALLKAAESHPMLYAYIMVLAETGARAFSEALQLRWDDIDFAERCIHIRSKPGRRTKSGKSRVVPMTTTLFDALQAHASNYRLLMYGGKRSEFVFHHVISRRTATAGERIRTLRAAFDAAVKSANLPEDFRMHDLRHRRVTNWLAQGKSPALVQLAMGHSDIRTTMSYSHLTGAHLKSLVEDAPTALTERPNAARN